MKSKYVLMIAVLCSFISIKVNAADFYAPWTKSTIVNNTKYPIKVSLYYSIPGCKLTDITGMPCTARGGMCDYHGCVPKSGQQYTLKPSKSTTIFNPSNEVLDGGITMPPQPDTNVDELIIELNNANVKPVKIENPTLKKYTVTFDGKTLSVQ